MLSRESGGAGQHDRGRDPRARSLPVSRGGPGAPHAGVPAGPPDPRSSRCWCCGLIIAIAFAATRDAVQGFVLHRPVRAWSGATTSSSRPRATGARRASARCRCAWSRRAATRSRSSTACCATCCAAPTSCPSATCSGCSSMAGDTRFRRLGDRVAGTMVVVEERGRVAAPLALTPPLAEGELDGFPQRPPLSAWERETLELFLRRADLTAARRDELAQMIAPAAGAAHGLQPRRTRRASWRCCTTAPPRRRGREADRRADMTRCAPRTSSSPPASRTGRSWSGCSAAAAASTSCRRHRSRAPPRSTGTCRRI